MKRIVSLIMVFTLILSFANIGSAAGIMTKLLTEDGRTQIILEFDDSKEAEWAMEYIAKMQSKKIFQGYEDGTFRPNQPVKRIEAIVTAVRLLGLEEEAKAKSLETKLYFKDAAQIDNHYLWAKGYVIVAVENGLFDASEDKLQPEKPASRLWVSSLLIRALGLEDEALSQMPAELDFTDANAIPAGSIGYVKLASDLEIVTGYPDGTFEPNKNVTRAEMATLLERTNDNYLEETGAIHIMGTITALRFDEEESVSNAVYTDGKITVKTFNGDKYTFGISSELYVQENRHHFIKAEELKVNDIVSLDVKNGVVVEAALLDQTNVNEEIAGIHELELKIEYSKDNEEEKEYNIKYKNDNGNIVGKIANIVRHKKDRKGKEDKDAVVELIAAFELTPDLSDGEILANILETLDISMNEVNKLELEIEFANGKEVKIEFEK